MSKIFFSMPSAQEMQSLIHFCEVMAKAPFYQKLGAGGVMAIYLTAKEYDLPFMACMNGGLHTFDGKVTFSAIMIDALILKAGHKTEVLQLDENGCRIRFTRGDRRNDPNYKPFEFEYTREQAAKAGYLSKNNWKTSLKDMLYSRCLTGGGRKHTPEVFVGILVSGELVGDDRDQDIPPLLPANVVQDQLPAPDAPAQLPAPVKHEKYDQFCLENQIFKGNLIYDYVGVIVGNNPKMNEVEVINSAIKHEKKFFDSFSKWKETKSKEVVAEQPRSMDEVAQQQEITQ
jgi:hypothetical protein